MGPGAELVGDIQLEVTGWGGGWFVVVFVDAVLEVSSVCVGAPLGLAVGDAHVGLGWWGSCCSLGCVLGNKTVIVGNGLAGGPVKNCPLNVFQLSKHRCLSSLLCAGGAWSSPCCAWGEPWASFACSLLWLCHPPSFQSCKKVPETAQV